MTPLTQRELGIAGVSASLGIVSGFSMGYFVATKRLAEKYDKLAEETIDKMREHYTEKLDELIQQQKDLANQPKPNLETVGAMAEVGSIIKESRYTPEEQVAIDEEIAREEEERVAAESENHNVFEENGTPEWDYAVESRNRSANRPYVIHKDEFMEGKDEDEWQQATLTYFEGDDVLSDEKDQIIDANRDSVVGEDNLSRFGHGSGDPNVVYVRNEVMTLDIEVLRSTGKYAEEVHGFIEHSEPRRKTPRFKDG